MREWQEAYAIWAFDNSEAQNKPKPFVNLLKIAQELDTELQQKEAAINRAFSILQSYGVPKGRAVTVDNGIEVLATRYRKEIAGNEYAIYDLKAAVSELHKLFQKIIDGQGIWGITEPFLLQYQALLAKDKPGDTNA